MEALCHIFPLCSKWLIKQSDVALLNAVKPGTTNNLVLFLRTISMLKASLLFQAAVSFAGEGRRVVYICDKPLESLPAPVHGMPQPTAEIMSRVKFVYLSCLKELMNYLSSVQLVADAPEILILCNLYHYASQDMDDAQQNLRKLCSLLSDVTSLEEKSNGTFQALVSSSDESISHRQIYSRYFPEIIDISEKKDGICECRRFTDERALKITYFFHKDHIFLDKVFENTR